MANRISLKTTSFLRHNLPSFYRFSRPDQHLRYEFKIETNDNEPVVFNSLKELDHYISHGGEDRIKSIAYRYISDWTQQ